MAWYGDTQASPWINVRSPRHPGTSPVPPLAPQGSMLDFEILYVDLLVENKTKIARGQVR